MATQSATVSCSGAQIVSYGDTPPVRGEIDHLILFDFLSPGNTAWIKCEELRNHFLVDSESLELDADLIQTAFIGVISLWAVGVALGLIVAMVRKLRA